MEFQYLKYFAAVARFSSFARAAEACHVSQPALSVQIKKLEHILGTQLFLRNTQKVSLTKEGSLLLPQAEQILADIEKFSLSAKAMNDHWLVPWTIGVTPALSYSSFFKKIKKVQKQFPDFAYSFRELAAPDLLVQLEKQTLDVIAIPDGKIIKDERLNSLQLDQIKLIAISPKNAGDKKLECISVHPGCGIRFAIERCAETLGYTLSTKHMAHHTDMLKHWVRIDLGWAIIPETALNHDDKRDLIIKKLPKECHLNFRIVGLDLPRTRSFFKAITNNPTVAKS